MRVKIITNKGDWSIAKTGKGNFVNQLIPAMEKLGVKVYTQQKDKADVELGIGKFVADRCNVRKRVVRIGPSHFDVNKNYKLLNKRKVKAVKESDGVIYQSEWCREVGHRYLGKNENEVVIFNGCEVNESKYERMLPTTAIMSTRKWVPQKRLKQALKMWVDHFGPEYQLRVLGECDKKLVRKFTRDNVVFLGPVDRKTVKNNLNHAKLMIHPVWNDACPNSVVEALGCGCPVVCSNQGGTKEIVSNGSGVIISESPWDWRPANLNKPPALDADLWANTIRQMFARNWDVQNISTNIRVVAGQYVEFFARIL